MTKSPFNPAAAHIVERGQPAPALEAFVDNFQLLSTAGAGPLPRVLPGTGALCFFPLQGAVTVTQLHAATEQRLGEPFVVCNRHHVLDFSCDGPARLLVASFRPGRLRYFTAAGFADLQDRITAAEDLWGREVRELGPRLAHTAPLNECIEAASALLVRVLRQKREARLDMLMDLLYLSPETRISEIAEEAGWSLRHFERLFTGTYGVSPKYFARVTRLQRVARRLALDPITSLSGSALDAGFFDQSHFVHELRRLAGLSPTELARGVRNRPHFYNPKSLDAYIAMLRSASLTLAEAPDAERKMLEAYRARTLARAERLVQP